MPQRSVASRKADPNQSPSVVDRSITLIGPRASGKTTYLSALAYFPERHYHKEATAPFVVMPSNPGAIKLKKDAQTKIKGGSGHKATSEIASDYSFHIAVNCAKPPVSIVLNAVDFPGEGLDYIDRPNSQYRKYLERKLTEQGQDQSFLIMLGDWVPPESDSALSGVFETFAQVIKDSGNPDDMASWRFAVVMNKCERGELWPLRHDPRRDIFQRFLPDTKAALEDFLMTFRIPPSNLEFFAMSTFGVLEHSPIPNRKKVSRDSSPDAPDQDILREGQKWRPYGLIEPLYWLATGRRLQRGV